MQVSREVAEIINSVIVLAKERHYELVTPELLLYVICENQLFAEAFEDCGGSIHDLTAQLEGYFNEYMVAVHSEECANQAPDQIQSSLLVWEACCPTHGIRRRGVGGMLLA